MNPSLRVGLVIAAATLLWSSLAGAEDDAGDLDATPPTSDADSGSGAYEDGGLNSASEDAASVSYQDPGFEEGLDWNGGCQDDGGTGDAGPDGGKDGDSSTDEENIASSGSIGCSLSPKASANGWVMLGLVGIASLRRRRNR